MSDEERETKPFKFVTGMEAPVSNYLGKKNRMIANCSPVVQLVRNHYPSQPSTTDSMRDG